jgi:hypothetical protein
VWHLAIKWRIPSNDSKQRLIEVTNIDKNTSIYDLLEDILNLIDAIKESFWMNILKLDSKSPKPHWPFFAPQFETRFVIQWLFVFSLSFPLQRIKLLARIINMSWSLNELTMLLPIKVANRHRMFQLKKFCYSQDGKSNFRCGLFDGGFECHRGNYTSWLHFESTFWR